MAAGRLSCGRDLVRAAIARSQVPRPPFVPQVYGYAAHVMQEDPQDVSTDPTRCAAMLAEAQRLFGYDAILTTDAGLLPEACGCELVWTEGRPVTSSHPFEGTKIDPELAKGVLTKGRLPAVLETTRRLAAGTAGGAALTVALPGPVTLLHALTGPDGAAAVTTGSDSPDLKVVTELLMTLVKAFGETNLDLVLFRETAINAHDWGLSPALHRIHQSLANLVRFFDAHPVVMLGPEGDLANNSPLPDADGLVVHHQRWLEGGTDRSSATLIALPDLPADSPAAQDLAYSVTAKAPRQGALLTTLGDWPLSLPAETALEVTRAITQA